MGGGKSTETETKLKYNMISKNDEPLEASYGKFAPGTRQTSNAVKRSEAKCENDVKGSGKMVDE